MTNEERLDQVLSRGIIKKILPSEKEFRERMLDGSPLRFYIGADPTSNALHLSHAKNFQLLEEFRLLGHEVIVLFGDFTSRIGDPTDRAAARSGLTDEVVKKNVEDWTRQIHPLMNFGAKENPPRILFNSEWLSKLTFEQVLNLASNMTVQRMLERDMFERRIEEQKPIFMHEFLYPLMQGFDSVAMDVDVELCGTDQIFNALVGRLLQKTYNSKDKFVVAVNLMENPVTGVLMSKSRGSGVFLDTNPVDLYGSVMAQPDEMIEVVLLNNTRLPKEQIADILSLGARDAKMKTALLITTLFHGDKAASAAEQTFVDVVQNRAIPHDIPTVHVSSENLSVFNIVRACLDASVSNSEIARLCKQRAIRLDGNVVDDREELVTLQPTGTKVNVGKRKWFNVVATRDVN